VSVIAVVFMLLNSLKHLMKQDSEFITKADSDGRDGCSYCQVELTHNVQVRFTDALSRKLMALSRVLGCVTNNNGPGLDNWMY
jgi:hypothetical protein